MPHHKTLMLCSLIATGLPAQAATDFYDSSSRTISVAFEQPVESVAVHITGTMGSKCTAPKSNVAVMNFIPGSTVKSDSKLSAKIAGAYRGAKGDIAASSIQTATSTTPAVFSYNYTGLLTNLHYNIVFTRAGKQTALGWRPDSGGGCTYPLP